MPAANMVRIASTTIRVAKMKTCEEKMSSLGGAVSVSPTPISAKPASATPLRSSSMTKWRRHKRMLTCADGKARKRRAWSSRATLAPITMINQTTASIVGAQNMQAMANSAYSAGMVTAAPTSLRANMVRSSYSNSGLMDVPAARRARRSFRSL